MDFIDGLRSSGQNTSVGMVALAKWVALRGAFCVVRERRSPSRLQAAGKRTRINCQRIALLMSLVI